MDKNKFDITLNIVKKVIDDQFPQFSNLHIKKVDNQGHDNYTFRLGEKMLIRMPTAECYNLKVLKEQKILLELAKYLTLSIPTPIAMGKPSNYYPFYFSIYKWIEGDSANNININKENLINIAIELANFIKELHKADISFGIEPGDHNFYRGDHISFYKEEFYTQIAYLKKNIHNINIKDNEELFTNNKVLDLFEEALKTKWELPAVWIHGDLYPGNILIKNNKLSGIIDFGCSAVGDPACDLVIAWVLFKGESCKKFIESINLDKNTILRAKAWGLWKATHILCEIIKNNKDIQSILSLQQLKIIKNILNN